MASRDKSLEQLETEIEELRSRLNEAEDALRAIQSGEVDALVVYAEDGERVYTLQGADHPYQVMVESINEGAATLLEDGTILYCNQRLAEMLAVPLEKLLSSSLYGYIIPTERDTFAALARKGMQDGGRAEFQLQRGDGALIPVQLSLSAVEVDAMRGICLIATDLTEHKHSEEIASAERMARSILEQAAEAIVVCDTTGTIIRASQAAQQMLEQSALQSPLFQPFADVFSIVVEEAPDGEKPFSIRDVLAGESFHGIEARLRVRAGEQELAASYVLLSAAALRNDEGVILGCIVSFTDITQRRQAEAVLREREMQHRLMDQREQERVQIARNLHDGPLQDILSLSYAVQSLIPPEQNPDTSSQLTSIREGLVKLVGDLRGVCNELRPPILARFGLAKAIRAYAEEFQAKYSAPRLALDLAEDGQSMPDGIRMALFRIFTEGLNNVIHHAGASLVSVRLTLRQDAVRLEIQDDGKGFWVPEDWIDLVRLGHLGLVGMKERAEALSGRIRIQSQPGKGTTIFAEIPWAGREG